MQLSDEHVEQFQRLYKEHFGQDLSPEEAREQGIRLAAYVIKYVGRPLTKLEGRKLAIMTTKRRYPEFIRALCLSGRSSARAGSWPSSG